MLPRDLSEEDSMIPWSKKILKLYPIRLLETQTEMLGLKLEDNNILHHKLEPLF